MSEQLMESPQSKNKSRPSKSTRTVTFEVRVDVSRDYDRNIEEEVNRALEYLRFAGDRCPMDHWIEVPYSVSDYKNKGPTHVRVTHVREDMP